MSVTNSLSISLQSGDQSQRDYVLIEQEEWGEDVGRTSTSQGVLAIGSMVFGGALPLPNCGGFDGFDAPVYVYPSRKDLQFKFAVSHGNPPLFGKGIVQEVTREEIVTCSLQSSVETNYPVQKMKSMDWIGPCYDSAGNVVAYPNITQNGGFLNFSAKVLGSLRVRYEVYRVLFTVRIEKREYSIENNFESVAYVVWEGGITDKDIAVPSGYEYTEGDCDDGKYPEDVYGPTTICPPPHGTYPTAVEADRETDFDYCSQVVTEDVITERVITDEDGVECE